MTKRHPRTTDNFVIDSVYGLKDIVNRHTVAGFEHIPDAIVYRRFYQLVKFLQDHDMTNVILFRSEDDLNDQSELRNSIINDQGFYFLQYALGKWEDRLYKDQGADKEWKFLEKWYWTFLKNNPDIK